MNQIKPFTTDNIETLDVNEIFVFASNLQGLHLAGDAIQAMEFGAKMYEGVGANGQTYAIPTKDNQMLTLPIKAIAFYVEAFFRYAALHQEKTFLVTKIGCGLAGHMEETIAPLFLKALDMANVILPESFVKILTDKPLNQVFAPDNIEIFQGEEGTIDNDEFKTVLETIADHIDSQMELVLPVKMEFTYDNRIEAKVHF